MSAYRAAIDRTTGTIERRARTFRGQIVAVVLVSLVAIVWALTTRSLAPLAGATVLLPVCGAFLFVDHRIVGRWRAELLDDWTAGTLDLVAYCAAIRANPVLPRGTIEGMLATLPAARTLAEEQGMTKVTRQAIAATVLAKHRTEADALALKTAASALAALVVIGAVVVRRWDPLFGLLSLALVPPLEGWVRLRNVARSDREVTACRDRADFSEPDDARSVGS